MYNVSIQWVLILLSFKKNYDRDTYNLSRSVLDSLFVFWTNHFYTKKTKEVTRNFLVGTQQNFILQGSLKDKTFLKNFYDLVL